MMMEIVFDQSISGILLLRKDGLTVLKRLVLFECAFAELGGYPDWMEPWKLVQKTPVMLS